jgi:pimeloyl-ACP methyl ester carboxylesterase
MVVAGHSLGALIALRLAIAAPHRVRGLILLTTGFPFRVHPGLAGVPGQNEPDQKFLAGALRQPHDPAALRLVSDGFRRLRAAGPVTAAWGIGVGETDIGDLSRVSVPVLVIVAGKDVVTSPRKGRALAAALPGAELVVLPGAGHYVHVEEPALVAGPIREFIDRLPTPRATSARVPE